MQINHFKRICSYFDQLNQPMPLRHLANSGGILNFEESWFDMVRPGLLLFGVYPSQECQRLAGIQPAMQLVSKISYFKVLRPGQSVSYGATWTTDKLTRVVTIPLGYGDGYPRSLSNKGHVLIRGKKYPIIGNICMDAFMVNLDWETGYNGDEVVLIGEQGQEKIQIETIANQAQTIPYEILTNLNNRIPREYFLKRK